MLVRLRLLRRLRNEDPTTHFELGRKSLKDVLKIKNQTTIMTLEKADAIRRIAMSHANKEGYGYLAQDFASYCVIRHFEKQISKYSFMFVDYLRVNFGDSRRASGQKRMLETHATDELQEGMAPSLHDPNIELFEVIDLIKLRGEDRVCFILSVLYGLNQKEIAFCLGKTEGRVSQILKDCAKRIRNRNINENRNTG